MTQREFTISSWETVRTFLREGTWSETIMGVVDRSYDHRMKLEEKASMPLAGGIVQHGYQCGMLWGAALAAGAEAYQRYGPGPKAETAAMMASQKIVEAFRENSKGGEINCLEITELDFGGGVEALPILKFFLKGGPIGCFRMASRYAPAAFEAIEASFSEDQFEAPPAPVSCTSLLARKMGLSDLHAVMAAGFAGGIGFSGGACGGLGAMIWIFGLESGKEGIENVKYTPPQAEATIERFLKSSDFEFECADIVGRKFEGVDDHAAYLREGGCAQIIEALSSE